MENNCYKGSVYNLGHVDLYVDIFVINMLTNLPNYNSSLITMVSDEKNAKIVTKFFNE